MRIMLLGAGGFIGQAILAELVAHGHDVTAVVRPGSGRSPLPDSCRIVRIDLARATDPAAFNVALQGIELVINAAGVLRGREMDAVHAAMPCTLCLAARERGVRRVVLISAISAREDVPTDYAASKLAGEAVLKASELDWTILRPSLVYGEGSYGGTSLLRGLAALPWFVPLPGGGDYAFSPIHVRDLARAVRVVCEDEAFAGRVIEPCGPETMPVRELLGRYRRWLGFGAPRFVRIPLPVMRVFGRISDIAGEGPVSTNSLLQLIAGNGGDGVAFAGAIGFAPRSLDTALRGSPAHVQDRWHARLYFLAPALRWVLALLWIVSAVLGLTVGAGQARAVVEGLGLTPAAAEPLRFGSSLADLAVAALVLKDTRALVATPVQLLVVLAYTVVIGIALPHLWLDPLGPLLKNLPILALVLVHGAVADRR